MSGLLDISSSQGGGMALKIYIRTTSDLPINSRTSTAIFKDPIEQGAQLKLTVSLRDDPLRTMRARNQIDEAQFNAGRKWQELMEAAQIGNVQAIDPGKEAVDGGMLADPISLRQMRATDDLKAADEALGHEGVVLIRDVLLHRMTLGQAAARRGSTAQREIDYWGRRFRECLETLAKHFQFA